jgi:hypothetical protein
MENCETLKRKDILNERQWLYHGHTDKVTVSIPLDGGKNIARTIGLDGIADHPEATHICVAGLKQQDFEAFVSRFGRQFEVIHFWKCPYVSDLSPLESLPCVRYITYFWNQKATRFWNMSKNASLVGFDYKNFTKAHSLEDFATSKTLQDLGFGPSISGSYQIDSLEPLTRIESLENLFFNVKSIRDGDVTPLLRIKNLKSLAFPTNLFTTEEVALLTARLKDVKSDVLAPFYDMFDEGSAWVVGKRKPHLDDIYGRNKEKLAKYVAQFEALVRKYENETLCSDIAKERLK